MSVEGRVKPVVYYRQHPSEFIAVGQHADVFMLNHPIHGTRFFSTTYVTAYDVNTGDFETLDTSYRPEEKK